MTFQEILNITLGVLASIGGGGWLVAALSKKFGDIWAKKYLQEHKNSLREQFEEEKRKIELEFEKSKTKYLRYSSKQFELYNSLWKELVDVESSANTLWDEASTENLRTLAQSLKNAKTKVEKSRLFLEQRHYENLKDVLKRFSEFRIGKKKLIELRFKEETTDSEEEIERALYDRFHVLKNEALKSEYENMLDDISNAFKSQIRESAT